MRMCPAVAEVPPAELVIAILAVQRRLLGEDFDKYGPEGLVRCELGLWHEDEHAGFVWDWRENQPDAGLWARWTPDGTMRFESLAWCEIEGGADGDACTLYRDHVREHSWDLRDPKMEAFRRRVFAENAELLAWLTRERS